MRWNTVTLAGVGLLGGSLGLALARKRLAGEVVGYVRRARSIRECQERGAVTLATLDLDRAVANADLIVLCTPLAQMRPLVERMLPAIKPGAVVTDVGSVKAGVVKELEPLIAGRGAHFVGSHPMAGAEKTGVAFADAGLFAGAACIVTATRASNPRAVREVERLWQGVGGRVLRLSPQEHDELVSCSSHLPHVVAAALAGHVLDPSRPKRLAALCANGFRDTTRIASGSPEMWRDIALGNRANIARELRTYVAQLQRFQRLLKDGDESAIEAWLSQAKRRRDRWSRQASSNSPE